MSQERFRRCLDPGMSVVVGTVDAAGTPVSCRGLALTSADDLATLTVYVPLATSQETIANVATTHRIAVTATYPLDNSSIQMKGLASAARLARDDEAPSVRAGLESFSDVLETIGIPKRVTKGINWWPAFAIEMRVQEIYEQTPGPKAGTRIR